MTSYLHTGPESGNDTRPVWDATLADLDLDKVTRHIQRCIERGRYTGSENPLTYLADKQATVVIDDVPCPTMAGLLCFGHAPQHFFPGAVIDLGHYLGTVPVTFENINLLKDIGGTLFDQLSQVETYLWTNTKHGMTFNEQTPSFQRIETHEYPRIVVRELTLNALAHRDYLKRAACRVMLFRNRIEWISPGGLPAGITTETLLQLQEARNPAIMRMLFEGGYVEAFGQGLDSVVQALRTEGLPDPLFTDLAAGFAVTVYGRPAATGELQPGLSEREKQLLDALLQAGQGIAMSELEARLQDQPSRRTLLRDLDALLKEQLIEKTGQGRWTRYRARHTLGNTER